MIDVLYQFQLCLTPILVDRIPNHLGGYSKDDKVESALLNNMFALRV